MAFVCIASTLGLSVALQSSGPAEPAPPPIRHAQTDGGASSQDMRSGSMVRSTPAKLALTRKQTPPPPATLLPPIPKATDAIALAVGKTLLYEDATTHERFYRIDLSWSGGQAPYKVSASLLPSFGGNNRTLALNLDAALFSAMADPEARLECYSISDDTFVSDSVQGIGYDPYPAPALPALAQNEKWWGDTVTVQSGYLDPIAPGNLFGMDALKVKADSVTVGADGFGSEATFTIPEDARGTWAIVEAHGLSSPAGYPLVLSPRGIGPFTEIRGVTYAPQTGHIWVAADDAIQEIDVFRHDPIVVRTLSGITKPYISRVTDDGRILFVSGDYPATMVYQVDVATGAMSDFHAINDAGFTRLVEPVGIAADRDGSCCYIADHAEHTSYYDYLVRVPSGSSAAVNGRYGAHEFLLARPCAMDVGMNHAIYFSGAFSGSHYIAYCPDANHYYSAIETPGAIAHSMEIDRDISIVYPSVDRFYWASEPGMAHGYNQNEIADPAGPFPARYLGAEIYAVPSAQTRSGMTLSVESMHSYSGPDGGPHFPRKVILNNAGQSEPYPENEQAADRVIKFQVRGFRGTTLHLKVIDPKDGAPYTPAVGWGATDPVLHPAVLPYEANDNKVWSLSGSYDFGITSLPTGDWPVMETDVFIPAPPNNPKDWVDYYIKLPERFSGDNLQVEILRTYASNGQVIPNQVPMLTDVFTGWKRVYVERDKMFRRGGMLYAADQANMVIPAGESFLELVKGPLLVRMDNVAQGDAIAIFDTEHPFEGAHDEAFVGAIDSDTSPDYVGIQLVKADCITPYFTQNSYTASPIGANHFQDFSIGRCAGMGVTHSVDGQISGLSSNQINSEGSAFFDADMRDIQMPFDDGFVEFYAPKAGMGAIPYLPRYWFDSVGIPERAKLSHLWFSHYQDGGAAPPPPNFPLGSPHLDLPHNYLHLIGASEMSDNNVGISQWAYDYSYIFWRSIEIYGLSFGATPAQIAAICKDTTLHETGHQFRVNACTAGGHDSRGAWCDSNQHCGLGGGSQEDCLMYDGASQPISQAEDGVMRFCAEDLLLGDPSCPAPTPPNPRDGSIRCLEDPL